VTTDLFVAIVRYTMLAGALYDLLFAVPMLAAPGWAAGILSLPMPDQEIYLRFTAVFLFGLALFYLLPVLHPGRYLGNVAAAAALRAMGGVFMVAAVLAYDQPRPFLLLGAVDLAFAGLHYLSLVPFAGLKVWRIAGADISARRSGRGRI
jgi:hypothetical protein